MTTARDIIKAAHRKIGVVDAHSGLTSDEADTGLEALNAMMHGWRLFGVDTSHTTLTINDAFPLGTEFEEGTTYLLASRIAPEYEVPAAFDADMFFRAIQAAYLVIEEAEIPSALRRMPSDRIRNGYLG